MNKRIRKKQQKQREQRKQLEMKWLLDTANAIDAAIQEYWRWREEMERRYVELSSPVLKCKKTPRKKCSFVAEEAKKR